MLQGIFAITGVMPSFEKIDCTDYQAMESVFKKHADAQAIIHFAASKAVNESVEKPLLYYRNNLVSLMNLLELMATYTMPNLVFSSSCTVYGQPDILPVTENSPIKVSLSPYGNTKQIGEEIITDTVHANKSIHAIILRYFNPVGAHISGLNGELSKDKPNNLVPFITQSAVGILPPLTVFGNDYDTRDGSCIRDYIHVSDIADAHVKAMNYVINDNQKTNTSIFNLGTGNGVTVFEAIQSFEKVSEQKLNYKVGERRAGDVIKIYANNNLAKQELGWDPKNGLDEMMLSAWKWQLNLGKEK